MRAGREFDEHHAEGKNVTRAGDGFAASLLGRHVADGSKCEIVHAESEAHVPSEAEIEDFDVAVVPEHDILRFDVGVDDGFGMHRGERMRNLRAPDRHLLDRHGCAGKRPKGLPFDEFGDEGDARFEPEHLMNGDEVGVVQR